MNPATGREFSFTNPQDDPQLYPAAPAGFEYNLDGTLSAIPRAPNLQDDYKLYHPAPTGFNWNEELRATPRGRDLLNERVIKEDNEESVFSSKMKEITGNDTMYSRQLYLLAKNLPNVFDLPEHKK
jgi:hypothetical protein